MDDEYTTTKAVYANDVAGVKEAADKIAAKEGLSGTIQIQKRSDAAGSDYYTVTWRK